MQNRNTTENAVLSGEVDMRRNDALEPAEARAGYVPTCRFVPVSDTVTVDVDA